MGGSCCGNNHDFVDKQRWELEIIDIHCRMEENASGYGGGWQMGQKSLTLSDNAVSFLRNKNPIEME